MSGLVLVTLAAVWWLPARVDLDVRTFWDTRRADRLLLISCRLGSEYKALVLEVPDPDAAAARLNAALVAS